MEWLCRGVAVQGRGHMKSGRPCEDVVHLPKPVTLVADAKIPEVKAPEAQPRCQVITLCDGAGSAAHAREGASLVSMECASFLEREFDSLFSEENATCVRERLFAHLHQALADKADLLGVPVKSLASTLLFVAIKEECFLLGQLGDGGIAYEKAGVIKLVSPPVQGEYLNETVFVTSQGSEAFCTLIKGELKGIRSFVLFSDGAAASLYQRREGKVAPAVLSFLKAARLFTREYFQGLLEHTVHDLLCTRTQDDCSLALMTCVPAGGFKALSDEERIQFLELKPAAKRRRLQRLERFTQLLYALETPLTIKECALKTGRRVQQVRVDLEYLARLRLIGKVTVKESSDKFSSSQKEVAADNQEQVYLSRVRLV